jgi:hypothetical protein
MHGPAATAGRFRLRAPVAMSRSTSVGWRKSVSCLRRFGRHATITSVPHAGLGASTGSVEAAAGLAGLNLAGCLRARALSFSPAHSALYVAAATAAVVISGASKRT